MFAWIGSFLAAIGVIGGSVMLLMIIWLVSGFIFEAFDVFEDNYPRLSSFIRNLFLLLFWVIVLGVLTWRIHSFTIR